MSVYNSAVPVRAARSKKNRHLAFLILILITARSIRGHAVFHLLLNGVHGLFEGAVYSEGANYSRKYGICESATLFLPKGVFPGNVETHLPSAYAPDVVR